MMNWYVYFAILIVVAIFVVWWCGRPSRPVRPPTLTGGPPPQWAPFVNSAPVEPSVKIPWVPKTELGRRLKELRDQIPEDQLIPAEQIMAELAGYPDYETSVMLAQEGILRFVNKNPMWDEVLMGQINPVLIGSNNTLCVQLSHYIASAISGAPVQLPADHSHD